MKIYTSYYAKCRRIPHTITRISIAGKAPAGYRGTEYKVLAPKKNFSCSGKKIMITTIISNVSMNKFFLI